MKRSRSNPASFEERLTATPNRAYITGIEAVLAMLAGKECVPSDLSLFVFRIRDGVLEYRGKEEKLWRRSSNQLNERFWYINE